MDSTRGKLLVAAPNLFDFFRRTVILMIEHTEEGAFGVVLNRPAGTTVGEAVDGLGTVTALDEELWIGGPVSADSVVILGEFEQPDASPKPVVERVGLVDPEEDPRLERSRVFAGHSGWGAGQLDAELERGAWLVRDAQPDDVFAGEQAWSRVTSRLGGEYALMASMPIDPSLN